jgi:hypothetical protein
MLIGDIQSGIGGEIGLHATLIVETRAENPEDHCTGDNEEGCRDRKRPCTLRPRKPRSARLRFTAPRRTPFVDTTGDHRLVPYRANAFMQVGWRIHGDIIHGRGHVPPQTALEAHLVAKPLVVYEPGLELSNQLNVELTVNEASNVTENRFVAHSTLTGAMVMKNL